MRMADLGSAPDTGFSSEYLYKGRRQTVAAWCAELGVSARTVHDRLRRGYSFAESIRPFVIPDDDKRPGTGAIWEHNGRAQNIKAWAKEVDLHENLILMRLTHGSDFAEAISKPRGKRRETFKSPGISTEREDPVAVVSAVRLLTAVGGFP